MDNHHPPIRRFRCICGRKPSACTYRRRDRVCLSVGARVGGSRSVGDCLPCRSSAPSSTRCCEATALVVHLLVVREPPGRGSRSITSRYNTPGLQLATRRSAPLRPRRCGSSGRKRTARTFQSRPDEIPFALALALSSRVAMESLSSRKARIASTPSTTKLARVPQRIFGGPFEPRPT